MGEGKAVRIAVLDATHTSEEMTSNTVGKEHPCAPSDHVSASSLVRPCCSLQNHLHEQSNTHTFLWVPAGLNLRELRE